MKDNIGLGLRLLLMRYGIDDCPAFVARCYKLQIGGLRKKTPQEIRFDLEQAELRFRAEEAAAALVTPG